MLVMANVDGWELLHCSPIPEREIKFTEGWRADKIAVILSGGVACRGCYRLDTFSVAMRGGETKSLGPVGFGVCALRKKAEDGSQIAGLGAIH